MSNKHYEILHNKSSTSTNKKNVGAMQTKVPFTKKSDKTDHQKFSDETSPIS